MGDVTIDLNGVMHIRGRVIEWDFCDGCFTGLGNGNYDIDINLAGGNGYLKGQHTLDLDLIRRVNHGSHLGIRWVENHLAGFLFYFFSVSPLRC